MWRLAWAGPIRQDTAGLRAREPRSGRRGGGHLHALDHGAEAAVRNACRPAILNGDGKPALHAHRFRHTLGTQLAEKGARTQTIMKILGHESPGMSMTYANISDPVGQLGQDALDWITTNFYKTELELGHCLRLPQEGPCECDLYLTCAKFVITSQYAPRPHCHGRCSGIAK